MTDSDARWEYCFVPEFNPNVNHESCQWQTADHRSLYLANPGTFMLMRMWFNDKVPKDSAITVRIKSSFKTYYKGVEIFSHGNLFAPEENPWTSKRAIVLVKDIDIEEPLYFIVTSPFNYIGKFSRFNIGNLSDITRLEFFDAVLLGFRLVIYLLLSVVMFAIIFFHRKALILLFPAIFGLVEGLSILYRTGNIFGFSELPIFVRSAMASINYLHVYGYLLPILGFIYFHIKDYNTRYNFLFVCYCVGQLLLAMGCWGGHLIYGHQIDTTHYLRLGIALLFPMLATFIALNRLYRPIDLVVFGFLSFYSVACFILEMNIYQFTIDNWADPFVYGFLACIAVRKVFSETARLNKLKASEKEISNRYKDLYRCSQMIVHDIVRPVTLVSNVIKIFSNCENAVQLKSMANKYTPMLEAACQESLDITNDFAFLERRPLMNLKPCCLNTLIRDCVSELVLTKTIDNETRVSSLVDPGIVVKVDSQKIKRVLKNLMINGVRYGSDSIPVRIFAIKSEDACQAGSVVVSVENQGSFIAEKNLVKIFEPFYSKHESLGLGLSICKKIIEGHQGRIWCQSSEETGTVFSFELKEVN